MPSLVNQVLVNKAMMRVGLGADRVVVGFAKMSVPEATFRVELVFALIMHFVCCLSAACPLQRRKRAQCQFVTSKRMEYSWPVMSPTSRRSPAPGLMMTI